MDSEILLEGVPTIEPDLVTLQVPALIPKWPSADLL